MDLLLDSNRLLNISFNSFLFENSRDKFISQFDTFYSLSALNQPISLQLWVISLISACIVGMVGLIPLCFIPFTLECISSEKNGNPSDSSCFFCCVHFGICLNSLFLLRSKRSALRRALRPSELALTSKEMWKVLNRSGSLTACYPSCL